MQLGFAFAFQSCRSVFQIRIIIPGMAHKFIGAIRHSLYHGYNRRRIQPSSCRDAPKMPGSFHAVRLREATEVRSSRMTNQRGHALLPSGPSVPEVGPQEGTEVLEGLTDVLDMRFIRHSQDCFHDLRMGMRVL